MRSEDDDADLLGAFEVPADALHPGAIAARLMQDAEHAHLAENEVRFLWLMRMGEHIQAGRRVLAMVHEPKVEGRLRDLFYQLLVKQYGFMPDFVVTVDDEWWRDATPLQREALVWHELMHVKHLKGRDGEPRYNRQTGEPVIGLVGHDVEEFNSTVERYGLWKDDLREFVTIASRHV